MRLEQRRGDTAVLIFIRLSVIVKHRVRAVPVRIDFQDDAVERTRPKIFNIRLCRDDRALADEEQPRAVGRIFTSESLPLADNLLAAPGVRPGSLRQVNLVSEYSHAEIVAEHVLVGHVIAVAVLREAQRHRTHDRHTVLRSLKRHRVDVRSQ